MQETLLEELIERLFEYKTLTYDTWNKEDWLCEQCLEKFVREHLHLWYVGQKVKSRLLPFSSLLSTHTKFPRRTHDPGKLLVWI